MSNGYLVNSATGDVKPLPADGQQKVDALHIYEDRYFKLAGMDMPTEQSKAAAALALTQANAIRQELGLPPLAAGQSQQTQAGSSSVDEYVARYRSRQ